MILSGRDLQLYIEMGKLKINPVTLEQFQQNGIDLILEDVELADQDYSFGPPVNFIRGEFYLGCTREILKLPDDLMAFVELRSTWARRGLLLPPTIVDAGFGGNLTLEIACFNKCLKIPRGERFAHLIFAKTSGPCTPYAGKYQNQQGVTGPKADYPETKSS